MSSSLPDGFDVRFATDADAAAVAELARAVGSTPSSAFP